MQRTLVPIALAAFVLALTPAVGAPRPRTVDVNDNFFAPSSLTIRKGTMVRFRWVGDNQHTVVKSRGPGRFFQSQPLEGEGVLYKHRFRKAGKYRLFCSLHEGMTMRLAVRRRRG